MIIVKDFEFSDPILESIWKEMEQQKSASMFQSFFWNKYWYEKVCKKDEKLVPFIKVVYSDEKPIAIFPFILRKIFFFNIIELFGKDQFDYKAPILKSFHDPEKIWKAVDRSLPKHDIKILERIPYLPGFEFHKIFQSMKVSLQQESNQILLPSNPKNLDFLSKRLRKDILRMKRKLSELGSLTISQTRNSKEYEKVIKETIIQKEKKYLETGAKNIFLDKKIKDFYQDLIYENFDKVQIHLSYLSLDSEILASHLGFIYKDTFYYILPSFKEGHFNKFSPGRILLFELIKLSIEKGLKKFDLTVGTEEYKKRWSNSSSEIKSFVEYKNFKGAIYYLFIKLIFFLKNNNKTRSFFMKLNKTIKFLK